MSLTPEGETSPVGITNGVGAFLLTAGGIVGTFSGDIAVSAGGLDAGATVAVRYNGTTAPSTRPSRSAVSRAAACSQTIEVATAGGRRSSPSRLGLDQAR